MYNICSPQSLGLCNIHSHITYITEEKRAGLFNFAVIYQLFCKREVHRKGSSYPDKNCMGDTEHSRTVLKAVRYADSEVLMRMAALNPIIKELRSIGAGKQDATEAFYSTFAWTSFTMM